MKILDFLVFAAVTGEKRCVTIHITGVTTTIILQAALWLAAATSTLSRSIDTQKKK